MSVWEAGRGACRLSHVGPAITPQAPRRSVAITCMDGTGRARRAALHVGGCSAGDCGLNGEQRSEPPWKSRSDTPGIVALFGTGAYAVKRKSRGVVPIMGQPVEKLLGSCFQVLAIPR